MGEGRRKGEIPEGDEGGGAGIPPEGRSGVGREENETQPGVGTTPPPAPGSGIPLGVGEGRC